MPEYVSVASVAAVGCCGRLTNATILLCLVPGRPFGLSVGRQFDNEVNKCEREEKRERASENIEIYAVLYMDGLAIQAKSIKNNNQ